MLDSYLTLSRHTHGRLVVSTRSSVDDSVRLTDVESEADGTAVELAVLLAGN